MSRGKSNWNLAPGVVWGSISSVGLEMRGLPLNSGQQKYLCDPALYFDNVQWYLAVLGPSEERTDLLIHGFIPKVIPVKPMATDHLPAVCPGAGANHQPGEFPRSLVGHCDDVCSGAPGLTWEAHWVYMKYMHAET